MGLCVVWRINPSDPAVESCPPPFTSTELLLATGLCELCSCSIYTAQYQQLLKRGPQKLSALAFQKDAIWDNSKCNREAASFVSISS